MPMEVGQLRAYARQLQRVPDKVRRDTETVLRASAARLEAGMKQRAAVDTGFMRNSIGARDESYGGDSMSVTVGPTADYSAYVEYGTSRMAPQPFVGPALDAVEPQFLAALDKVAGRAFE